ncbi:MAG TPA: hypothetical protein VGC42_19480 [Kofleriaceae bacterium]
MPRLVALGVILLASAAHAAPAALTVATCGESKLELVPKGATPGELRVALGGKPTFTAPMGVVTLGSKTRTISVSDVVAQAAKAGAPSGLIVDLLFDEKKVLLRHAGEGPPDVDYAVDLDRCTFNREVDGLLLGFAAPPAEPVGCAPAQVRGPYRTQVGQVAKLADAELDREARALCEDHQKTIEARARLERELWDRIARSRITAKTGPALLHAEDAREKLWSKLDGCLGADAAAAKGVAALHDGEARQRACYGQVKP